MINSEICVWDALKNSEKPIILYGMGNGADKVLDEFSKRDIMCYGVMASDDFVRYQQFRGFTVKKMSDFEEELGDFIIALCFASSLPDVMEHIKFVSERHTMLVPSVPVYTDEVVDDDFINKYKEQINEAYSYLADDKSRKVFEGTLNFLYSGKLQYLLEIDSDKDEVFAEILKLSDNESYLDLGAYRGDTVDEFLHYVSGYEKIVAVEPNLKNHAKMVEHCETFDGFVALNMGISDSKGTMLVSKGGGRQSVLLDKKGVKVAVTTVDDILNEHGEFTYIKADIEGMEHSMLKGAVNALSKKPKLNIAGYHTNSDFFTLINAIKRINPEYRVYLRKHPYIPCWDLNIYGT